MARPGHRRARLLRLLGQWIAVVRTPLLALFTVFSAGTLGYYLLGHAYGRDWSLLDCAYMTSISLTTVGYGDVLGVGELAAGRIYTMLLLVSGLGATLYSVSAVTAFIVEGHLGRSLEEMKMENRIDRLERHTIICGCGRTGLTVAEEHKNEERPFVLIDLDEARITRSLDGGDLLYVVGDATDEEVLARAGVARAASLVATLGDDKANMFLVVTARYGRPKLRIVSECLNHDSAAKFRAAGADQVVSPSFIGGQRLASHVLRPGVVDFIDSVTRRGEAGAAVHEIRVEKGSALEGRTVEEVAGLEASPLPIVAVRDADDRHYAYAPRGDHRLVEGAVLVVIGPHERTKRLLALAQA